MSVSGEAWHLNIAEVPRIWVSELMKGFLIGDVYMCLTCNGTMIEDFPFCETSADKVLCNLSSEFPPFPRCRCQMFMPSVIVLMCCMALKVASKIDKKIKQSVRVKLISIGFLFVLFLTLPINWWYVGLGVALYHIEMDKMWYNQYSLIILWFWVWYLRAEKAIKLKRKK